MKNFVSILILIILSHCGYSSIYNNSENQKFKIVLEEMSGDKSINNLIRTKLKRYSSDKNDIIYTINSNTNFTKTVLSKDKTGKATNIKLFFEAEFKVKFNGNIKSFSFKENLNIENSSDTYEQNNYENVIENNFVSSIIEKLIVKLTLLQ